MSPRDIFNITRSCTGGLQTQFFFKKFDFLLVFCLPGLVPLSGLPGVSYQIPGYQVLEGEVQRSGQSAKVGKRRFKGTYFSRTQRKK